MPLAGGEIGYLHPVNGLAPSRRREERPPAPTINVGAMMEAWSKDTSGSKWRLMNLAADLGVSVHALQMLECVKAPYTKTWAFPMRDGYNEYTGIRLRHENGDKWAEPGSHAGIFMPQTEPQKEAFICEGPTDTAAALTLGLFALGRPSCSGGVPHIQAALKRTGVKAAVIIADNDDPGLRGAEMLCGHLPLPTAILVLPAKDIRDFLRRGGTADDIRCLLRNVVWHNPRKETVAV